MTLRPLTPDDAPVLRSMERGNPYPTSGLVASAVVADSAGAPLMVAVVTLQPQACLYMGECSAVVKLAGLRMLHMELARQLRALGYSECDAEIPPGVSLGRTLKRMGWIRNTWEKWFVRF